MLELHLPWLELTIVTPLIGALVVSFLRNPEVARQCALVATGVTLCFALAAWEDFSTLHTFEAHDHGDIVSPLLGNDAAVIDELSAPLFPWRRSCSFSLIWRRSAPKSGDFRSLGRWFPKHCCLRC